MDALADRINVVLYLVGIAVVLSGGALVLSGWLIWAQGLDRAANAAFRARVIAKIFPDAAATTGAALPAPRLAAPSLAPQPLYDAWGPSAERGSVPSQEPPEPGDRYASLPPDHRRRRR